MHGCSFKHGSFLRPKKCFSAHQSENVTSKSVKFILNQGAGYHTCVIFCDEHADFILEVMRCLQLAIDPTATLAISETWEVFLSRSSSMFISMNCSFQAVLNFMFCFVISLAITEISVITFTDLPGRHHSECQFRPLHQAKLVHVAHTKGTRFAHRRPTA